MIWFECNCMSLYILSASRLVRTVLPAGHGVRHGRTVWQKLAIATVSPRSLCHGAALVWLDGAWDEAAGQFNLSVLHSHCCILIFTDQICTLLVSCIPTWLKAEQKSSSFAQKKELLYFCLSWFNTHSVKTKFSKGPVTLRETLASLLAALTCL